MKKIIRSSCKLLLALLLVAGFSHQTYASHYQGSDLTYLCVAPDVYVVTANIYRDCSGIDLSASETLKVSSPGCNTGRSLPIPKVPFPPGVNQFGTNLYCPTQQANASCTSSASLPNYETGVYRTTITFSTAEKTCTNWYFSLRLGNRPSVENLGGSAAQSTYLYSEAYLNLNNTINNNSPEFNAGNIPVPFVCVNQPTVISMNAAEQDNDSLSYELAPALDDFNTPIAYSARPPGTGGITLPPNTATFTDPASNICYAYNQVASTTCPGVYKNSPFDFTSPISSRPAQLAILPAGSCTSTGALYSAGAPMPVLSTVTGLDWSTCQTNFTVSGSGFSLDPLTGVLRFTPNRFTQSAPSAGRNKYAVVVQINEWRKINGVMTKVGHIRRDMLIIVNNCLNAIPVVTVPKPDPITGAIFQTDTVFNVQTCTTTRFMINHNDPDNNILNVRFPNAVLIPNGGGNYHFPANPAINFDGIPGLIMKPFTNMNSRVNVAFYMTPNTNTVGQDYLLHSIVTDNACPLNGRVEQTYRIRIVSSNRVAPVAGVKDRTICLGDSTPINTILLRPDSIFQSNAISPGQYSFLWTETNEAGGLPNGLRPADQTKRNIVVKPTQTTRYFLSVTSSISGCRDTTSILVRVDTQGRSMVSGDDTLDICIGSSAFINIRPDTVNGLPVTYTNYQWAPAPGLSAAQLNLPNIVVTPTTTTRYFLTTTDINSPGCSDTTSVLVRVDRPDPINATGLEERVICGGGATPVTVTLNNPDPLATYTYFWELKAGTNADSAGFDITQANLSSITVKPLKDTWYYLTVQSSRQACADTDSVLIRVNNSLNDVGLLTASPRIEYRGTSELFIFGLEALQPYTFEWTSDNPDDAGQILGTNERLQVSPLSSSNYFVKVTNSEGCDTTLTARIDVGSYFTNIITPNGDGMNDFLELPNIPANTMVQIYNRWGKLIKEYKNYENIKGKAFDGKGLSDGTYYYYVKIPNGPSVKGWLEIRDNKK